MKWKTLFILVLLTFLVSSKVYKVSAAPKHLSVESFIAKSVQEWNPSALHGSAHLSFTPHKFTIPTSTLSSGLVTKDDEEIGPRRENNVKANMDAKNDENIRKILTMRKFAMRRAAKRHNAVQYISGTNSSASPLKEAFVLHTRRPTFITDLPSERSVKSPVVLTSLPIGDEGTFSPPADSTVTESKEHDTAEEGERKISRDDTRVTEHDRPSQSGTASKTQPLETGAHYDITSSGLRWNTVYDLKTGAEHEGRRKRYKKKRKAASSLTEEVKEDDDNVDDPGQSGSSIIIAAVCAGVLVLLCVFAGLAGLWKNCKKRCLRKKDPEFGMEFYSPADFSEQLSEEELLLETMVMERESLKTSKDSAKSKTKTSTPPCYQLAATHGDIQATWILTDTPTSTPLMVVSVGADTPKQACTVVEIDDASSLDNSFTCPSVVPSMAVSVGADTPKQACTVVEIDDASSLDNSFTCSSLSDSYSWPPAETPRSSSSLTSVSSLELTSEPEVCISSSSLASKPGISIQSASLTSTSAIPLKPETEIAAEHPVSPTFQPEVTTETPTSTSAISLNIEPEVFTSDLSSTTAATYAFSEATVPVTPTACSQTSSESILSSQPATPKHSSGLNLTASASDESTRTVSMTTDSSSSRESCKTPVAPRDEVVITIEDDEDDEVIYTIEKPGTRYTVIDNFCLSGREDDDCDASGVTTKSVDGVTKSLENAGVTCEVGDSAMMTVESAKVDISGVTSEGENCVAMDVENYVIDISGAGVTGVDKDGVTVVEDAVVEISGMTGAEQDSVTVTQNAVGEEEDVVTLIENALIEISGVTSGNEDGVTVVENAAVEISDVTSEKEDDVIVVDNAVIEITNVTNERESVVMMAVDNKFDGITRMKPDVDKNRGERLSERAEGKQSVACQMTDGSNMALDEGAPMSSPVLNAWDEIYKERAKSMLKHKKVKKDKRVTSAVFQPNPLPPSEEHVCSEISGIDHKKNPQVGCLCHYCEKHRQKSRGHRFLKLPRKLMSFKSKSSSKHVKSGYEACSSTKYSVPTSEACVSAPSAERNAAVSSAANSGLKGEQQIHYLPNKCDVPGVILPRSE